MDINIKASKTTITPAIEADVRKKMEVLADFIREEDRVSVEVEARASKNNDQEFRAEVAIQPSGHFAEASGSDLYEAIDLVIPKIRQQLVKEKDKRVSLRRKLGSIRWKFWKK